jgi:hypothetical protein
MVGPRRDLSSLRSRALGHRQHHSEADLAIEATCRVLEGVTTEMIGSFSYRTPTAIVGSADITLNTRDKVTKDDLVDLFATI